MKTNLLMKRLLLLWVFAFSTTLWGQHSIAGSGVTNTYTQNFDTFRGTAITLPTNWTVSGTYNNTAAYQVLNAGSSTPGTNNANGNNVYAGRASTSSTDYSILQKQATTGSSTFTFKVKNDTGSIINGFVINWNIEQFALGGRATTVDFKYRVNAGSYTNSGIVGTTLYTSATGTPPNAFNFVNGTPKPYSVTISGISVAAGETVDFQFIVANGTGSGTNAYVGIDDFSVYATAAVVSPIITVTPEELNDLTYIFNNGPSAAKSFNLSGTNLDGTKDVLVSLDEGPASNFEISLSQNSGYTDNLIISNYNGSSTPIFVQLKAGKSVASSYGDNISILNDYNSDELNVLVFGAVTPSITATSNNNAYGTVSLAGNLITATPAAGFTYASTAYTITPEGSATVSQAGNQFTVNATASTAIQINFEAKPTFTLSLMSDGLAYSDTNFPLTTYEGNSVVLPNLSNCRNLTFVGWDSNSTVTTAPTFAGGATYNTTASNVTLYAVFSRTSSGQLVKTSNYGFEDSDTGWNSDATKLSTDPRTGTYSGRINTNNVHATFDNKVPEPASISFWLKKTSSNNNYDIQVQTSTDNSSWTTIVTYPMSVFTNGSWVQKTADLSAYSNVYVRLYYDGTTATRYLDDITLIFGGRSTTVYTTMPNCIGAPVTWNGTSWSNVIGPDETDDAIIDGTYSINTSIVAKSLSVNADKTLTINSSVTTGDLTNNGTIIVNDNASLMQTPEGNYSGAGTFTVNRNAVSEAGKYAFWSSPVVDQNMYGIFSTAPQYVMTYNTASNYYDIVTGDDAKAKKGIGYSISTPDPAPTASTFVGAPNNGTFNTDMTLATYNFNLVGNPYPSNLDLTKFLSGNTANIESTLWFWDNKSGPVKTQNGTTATSNGYATFNAMGTGVWVAATSLSASPQKTGVMAKMGQAFIVKAKSNTLNFNNDMRSVDEGSNFNKSTGNAGEGKYWLTLTTPYNTRITQAITYQEGASNSYDDYDSKARSNGSDAFYSLVGAEKVIIQGKAPFTATDVVVLGNKHFENGNFKIELTKTEGLFADGQAIYLRDKVAGTETNLQQGAYLFSANAGDYADRFEVVYKQPTLATGSSVKATLAVYRNGDDFVIDSPSKISSVEVYDASGKAVKLFRSSGNKETVSNLSRGVYVFKITTATEIVTKKVIK